MMSQPVSQFGGGCEERQGVEVEVAGAGPQPHREVSPNGQKFQHFAFSFKGYDNDRTVWSVIDIRAQGH
jgi:hypothetical protein